MFEPREKNWKCDAVTIHYGVSAQPSPDLTDGPLWHFHYDKSGARVEHYFRDPVFEDAKNTRFAVYRQVGVHPTEFDSDEFGLLPILGPACRISPFLPGTTVVPIGAGTEVQIQPEMASFVYADVGFWGARKRNFALVCGPHIWLCDYRRGARFSEVDGAYDFCTNKLRTFVVEVGDISVYSMATAPLRQIYDRPLNNPSRQPRSLLHEPVHVVLPDFHMWPDPRGLAAHPAAFFSQEELDLMAEPAYSGVGPTDPQRESRRETLWRRRQLLRDHAHLEAQLQMHFFSDAAADDLCRFLDKIAYLTTRHPPADAPPVPVLMDTQFVQVGDLLEMWAPDYRLIDEDPFERANGFLMLTSGARTRLPKFFRLILERKQNRDVLDRLMNLNCHFVYGNHDVYRNAGFGLDMRRPDSGKDWPADWNPNLPNVWPAEPAYPPDSKSDGLMHAEHGHRFDDFNADGRQFGMSVASKVVADPALRSLENVFVNPAANVLRRNIPYAGVHWLLANGRVSVVPTAGARLEPDFVKLYIRPRSFWIFVQGHTHVRGLFMVSLTASHLRGVLREPAYRPGLFKRRR